MSATDYRRLYRLQDKFLTWWKNLNYPFYLTGGTALGRFYLNHRFSEDLDFFCNADPRFKSNLTALKNLITRQFQVNLRESLFSDDFAQFYICEEDLNLKIEFLNDVEYFPGKPIDIEFGLIDTPLNILANKLTAIIGRDEPKDFFDIVQLSLSYSFSWPEIFYHSKQKSIINEIDVADRLFVFPAEWLENVNFLFSPPDIKAFQENLRIISDDFLLGKQNSLGLAKTALHLARPGRLSIE
jgi:hypothetical protein